MGYPTKIATCCYCGSKAALVLGKDRHELTCSTCGAPLHDMKRFRQDPGPQERRAQTVAHPKGPAPNRSQDAYHTRPRKKSKKRKSMMRFLVKEAFDVIEDIFD